MRQEAQMETEVLDEVVLKDQNQDSEPCMVGFQEPGLTGTLANVLLSPSR